MKKLHFILFFLAFSVVQAQQGGMWIPSLLKGANEKEMKSLGMKISAKDIYDANHSSIKDAIPQFDGGCTSEVISNKGLLLTNHHCGFSQIQAHSSLENDYITNGFWAKSLEEELPNIGTDATFVVRIEDVTEQVLKNTENLSAQEKAEVVRKNIQHITETSPKEEWQENRISAFFHGNQYLLFVVEVFEDVRLVGTPPASIGKFGSDTDNWVYPRHTGDFALFRIYADKNNRPAKYSKENVPYKPKHFLPISIKGLKEDDFTFVFGYPGRTNEYLPAVAIEQIVEKLNPIKIQIREEALKIQEKYMRQSPEIKIQYASKNARIANYWKKWKGESLGLKKANVVQKKRDQEQVFLQNVHRANKQNEYGNLLTDFEKLYAEFLPYQLGMNVFEEVVFRNTELLSTGVSLARLFMDFEKGEEFFNNRKERIIKSLETKFKDYNSDVDKEIFAKLIEIYLQNMPREFVPEGLFEIDLAKLTDDVYSQSALVSLEKIQQVLNGTPVEVMEKLSEDLGVQLVMSMYLPFYENLVPTFNELNLKIAALQQQYMKAIIEFSKPSDRIFPDANSTLRVTYGKVKGYSPSDAVHYTPFTYLEGVMEKYVPNDYEFDVPEKLRELYHAKDYGIYADKNGKLPVCFIATNHTTGGNSGSPALDAHGNLVGLNFDRVWEGTMSDIYYDPEICRNIMVDTRYILFIIDKFAGAKNLINEMKIIK